MKTKPFASILAAAVFTLALSASLGSRASAAKASCWGGEPGYYGCLCFCANYADDTANDDQHGTRSWNDQFDRCFRAQGYCWWSATDDTEETREQNMLKLERPEWTKDQPKLLPVRPKQ